MTQFQKPVIDFQINLKVDVEQRHIISATKVAPLGKTLANLGKTLANRPSLDHPTF